jgi:hypothetical protein
MEMNIAEVCGVCVVCVCARAPQQHVSALIHALIAPYWSLTGALVEP